MSPEIRAAPPHVPPGLVVDFDFIHPSGADTDPYAALKRLHAGPDIFWTPHNGGHWVATRGADIRGILSDNENFSSRAVFIPPMKRPPVIPLEVDPPAHAGYRRLISPAFFPKAVANWSEQARGLAVSIIEKLRPFGECEFVGDFAQQLPIIIFLRMCDLPLEDREMLLGWVGASLRPTDPVLRDQARASMSEYIRKWIALRRAAPGDDLLSRVVTAEIDGRRLDDLEVHSIATGLLGGGLDTVAASMSWMARFLAEHPAHRQQLIDDPELIANAIEELLRRFSVPNIARVVAKDLVYKGVAMKGGEQILLSACLHGMDEQSFEDPLTVDFARKDARMHSTFSQGIHRCPGSMLALAELRFFLEEWLRRIPDFWIKPGETVRTATGIVHGVLTLPLAWNVR